MINGCGFYPDIEAKYSVGNSYCGGFGYGYGGCYGNKDALTLRGPLEYDQYGPSTVRKDKNAGFWKGLLGTAAAIGAGVLAWRCPAVKNCLKSVGKFFTDIAKKFVK